MSRWEWLKVIVFILVPINTWLGVFYYLHYQKRKIFFAGLEHMKQEYVMLHRYLLKKFGVQVGQRLKIPHQSTFFIGSRPPLGQGYPVCFIYVSGNVIPEIWEPTILEALKASPYLYVVLLHTSDLDLTPIRKIFQRINNPRLSILAAEWVPRIFGAYHNGIFLVLCDGKGIIQAIEPFPQLKVSPSLNEEIADWRIKLHQTIKKVLDKFF